MNDTQILKRPRLHPPLALLTARRDPRPSAPLAWEPRDALRRIVAAMVD